MKAFVHEWKRDMRKFIPIAELGKTYTACRGGNYGGGGTFTSGRINVIAGSGGSGGDGHSRR